MLAMGRALMSNPQVVLLDEPSLGLSPMYVKLIFKIIKEINEQGVTVLLVEQNARKALSIAHRGYVLETGEISVSGMAAELRKNKKIQEAYLGGAALKK
jgi:branched-chain amino acid transport system ATP-binding protein